MLTMATILRAQKMEATYGRGQSCFGGSGLLETSCHNPPQKRTRPAPSNDVGDSITMEYGRDPCTGELRYFARRPDAT